MSRTIDENRRIEIADALHVAATDPAQGCKLIAEALRFFRLTNDQFSGDLENILFHFECMGDDPSVTEDEVDDWLSELYDWADAAGVRVAITRL